MIREAEIINLLAEATHAGKQKWEPTAIPEKFLTTLGQGFTLTLAATPDENGEPEPDIMATFYDAEGRTLSTVLNNADGTSYVTMRNLHSGARRSALNVDDSLDTILKSLRPKP